MSLRNVILFVAFSFCFSAQAQSIYFNFKDGTHSSYLLSDVRSITFTGDVMNLNKTNGTTDSWNVSTIGNYNFNGFLTNIKNPADKGQSNFYVYPNPAKGPINLQYEVKQAEEVTIEITDLNGKLLRSLPQKQQLHGNYTITWAGTDDSGNYITSGIYFCRIIMSDISITKKLIITTP